MQLFSSIDFKVTVFLLSFSRGRTTWLSIGAQLNWYSLIRWTSSSFFCLENHLREKVHVYSKGRLLEFHYREGELKSRDSGSTYAVTYSTYCKLTHLWRSHALTAALGETHSGEMSVRGQILDCIHLHLWTDFQIRCARWSSIITTSHHHVICLKDFVKILLEQSIYKKCCKANSILHCITLAYSKKYVHI